MMNNINNMIIMKIKCNFCGYGWKSRVTNPKSCPLCKRYIIEKPALSPQP